MQKLIHILIACGLMVGTAVPALAQQDCPCAGGTEPYTVDCDGDREFDACSTDECPHCTTQNPDPVTPGYECCGNKEFDPSSCLTISVDQYLAGPNDYLESALNALPNV